VLAFIPMDAEAKRFLMARVDMKRRPIAPPRCGMPFGVPALSEAGYGKATGSCLLEEVLHGIGMDTAKARWNGVD